MSNSLTTNKREIKCAEEGISEIDSEKPNCFEGEYAIEGAESDEDEREEDFYMDNSFLSGISMDTSLSAEGGGVVGMTEEDRFEVRASSDSSRNDRALIEFEMMKDDERGVLDV